MGTYSTWEFYETFGGWPEPGETYPDDPDAARDELEARTAECELCEGRGVYLGVDCPRCRS